MWAVYGAEVLQSIHELLNLAGVTTLPEVVCLFVLPSGLLSVWAKFRLPIHVYEQRGCQVRLC